LTCGMHAIDSCRGEFFMNGAVLPAAQSNIHAVGLLRKYWLILLVPLLLVAAFFVFQYSAVRKNFVNEVRNHARYAATCTASAIDPADIERIRAPADADGEPYRRIQRVLTRFHDSAGDIRYVYVMRRSAAPDAKLSDYEFVVDMQARDANGNGAIDEDEKAELPGAPYDASRCPMMVLAWSAPTADEDVTPDPPYPDLLSGYAPIKDKDGRTVAIVGADITARTIRTKLLTTRTVVIGCGLVLSVLFAIIVFFYCGRREALLRIRQINAELEVQNRKLEEIIELRDQLSRMIVHDMRNLLTVIVCGNDSLASAERRLSEEERAEQHEIIRAKSRQMERFLEQMLIMAKSESGKLAPRLYPVDVNTLISEAARHYEVVAQTYAVRLAVDLLPRPISIQADADLLARVIDNLLSNAISYSPSSGTVRLAAEALAQGSSSVRIRVMDEGPGIDPAVRQHLFEEYAAGQDIPGRKKNFGLGLAFCKMAVEAHGGRIYTEDSAKGTVFVVEL
jgi:signal transduction histidine kinase